MRAFLYARDERTPLVRVITHRHELVPRFLHEADIKLRGVVTDVDAALCHHTNRERMDRGLFRSGALCLETVAGHRPQKSFRHLTTGGVVRTQEEDALLVHLAPPM